MSPRARRLSAVCLVAALALAAVAEYYLARRRNYLGDAVFIYALASVLFMTAIGLVSSAPAPPLGRAVASWWGPEFMWLRAKRWRLVPVLLSILIILVVGGLAANPLTAGQGYALLALWAGALLLYLAAVTDFAALRAWLPSIPSCLRASPWEPALVLALFVVAAIARLIGLSHIPWVLGGDEASMGQEAVAVLQGTSTNPFATGWLSHPTLFFYLQAVPVGLLGATTVALRVVPALAGALTVPALYLLAKELFDRRIALISAFYLACYHYAIHFSRLGLNNMIDPFLATAAFFLLLLGLRKRRIELFALSGLLLGLDQYAYMGSRVIPIVLVAWLIWTAWRTPGFWSTHRGSLTVLGGAFALTGWPLFLFFARHPQDFTARTAQLAIYANGYLQRTADFFHISTVRVLEEQVVKSVLAFHYYPDPGVFYRPGMPLLDVVAAVPFTFGLVYALLHLRESKYALFSFWFWAVLIFGGMMLENPPNSQRIVLTIVPVSAFIAVGITLAADVAERAFRWQRSSTHVIVGAFVVLLAVISLGFYFGSYSPTKAYADRNTEVGQEMGYYLRSLGPQYRYYFFGAPRMYADFPNTRFLAPQVEGEDVLAPLSGPPTFVKPGKRPVFIFLPERKDEVAQVELSYPTGKWREFRDPSGELLFTAYEPN